MTKLKDNELLLLRYPDLYGPIEQFEEADVADEMQNQISANQHRISLLTNLNDNLSNSVRRLNETQSRAVSRANTSHVSASSANHNHSRTINRSEVQLNEFMKPDVSRTESRKSEAPKSEAGSRVPSRAYPLFKLDSEIEAQTEDKEHKQGFN